MKTVHTRTTMGDEVTNLAAATVTMTMKVRAATWIIHSQLKNARCSLDTYPLEPFQQTCAIAQAHIEKHTVTLVSQCSAAATTVFSSHTSVQQQQQVPQKQRWSTGGNGRRRWTEHVNDHAWEQRERDANGRYTAPPRYCPEVTFVAINVRPAQANRHHNHSHNRFTSTHIENKHGGTVTTRRHSSRQRNAVTRSCSQGTVLTCWHRDERVEPWRRQNPHQCTRDKHNTRVNGGNIPCATVTHPSHNTRTSSPYKLCVAI